MIADNIRVKTQSGNDFDLQIKSKIQWDKLIVNAYSLDDKIEYQGELQPHPYIDFQDIQELIDANKTIKIVTKTSTLLKIKVGTTPIQLVGKQKIDLQNLSETFEKFMKNQSLMEKQMKEQKEELNQHKNLIIGLKKQIQEMKLNHQEKDLKSLKFQQAFTQEKSKIQNKIQQNLNEILKIKQEIRSKIEQIQYKPASYENLNDEIRSEINQLKFELKKTSTIVSEQSEQLKQQETKLEQLISYLQRRLNFQLQVFIEFQQSLSISCLNQPIRSCKWNKELKSRAIKFNNNVITKTKKTDQYEFCLLNASFTNTLEQKQSWKIQINELSDVIYFGIFLKSKKSKHKFNGANINLQETGHGLYMICSDGDCFSHSQQEFNCENKSFEFGVGDVIDIEYDPIESKLRFSQNLVDSYFEMPIIAPPYNDAYYPLDIVKTNTNTNTNTNTFPSIPIPIPMGIGIERVNTNTNTQYSGWYCIGIGIDPHQYQYQYPRRYWYWYWYWQY